MNELGWPVVATRLAAERDLWVGTTGPDGRPHASPVWAVVVDGTIYFFSTRTTVKARNLVRDPRLVVHSPSANDVTIVHGTAIDLGHPAGQLAIIAAFLAKYDEPEDAEFLPLDPTAELYVLYRVEPVEELVWELTDYEGSQRRWRR